MRSNLQRACNNGAELRLVSQQPLHAKPALVQQRVITMPASSQIVDIGGASGPASRAVIGATQGLWEWRSSTDSAWFSHCFAALVGWPTKDQERLLADWIDRVHPADARRLTSMLRRCAAEATPVDLAYRLRGPDDEYRWFRTRAMQAVDEQSGETYVSGGIHDIHDQRAAAEASRKQELNQLQRQRMESAGSLAGGVAHEFNNLLQAIGGYVSFARDELDPESQTYDDLSKTLTAVDRAAKITHGLLQFTRAKPTGEETVFDAVDMVAGVLDLVRSVAGRQVDLVVELPREPIYIKADADELRQSVLNLCLNARDAMPEGGIMRVAVEPTGVDATAESRGLELPPRRQCQIVVADNGCGLSADILPQIFDPFFTTKDEQGRTGLGLSVVYGFATRSGGNISATSKGPGTGAEFTLRLPQADNRDASETATANMPMRSPANRIVLLADDELLVREVGTRILESAGYQVLVQPDGKAALACYLEHAAEISCVLLDALMPGLTGLQVLSQIRDVNPTVPIVMNTGCSPHSTEWKELESAADAVFEKPFEAQALLDVVQNLTSAGLAAAT